AELNVNRDATRPRDAAAEVRPACLRWRLRLQSSADRGELSGELLKLCYLLGDLCLLHVEELTHAVTSGPAVGACPDRDQRRDLLATEPHPPGPGDEQQATGRVLAVVAVTGGGTSREAHQADPLVVAHCGGRDPGGLGELGDAHLPHARPCTRVQGQGHDLEPGFKSYVRRTDRNPSVDNLGATHGNLHARE